MSGARHWEQDKDATVYIGNLDERVTDDLVWELMLQAGRIVNVHLPKDRVTQTHQGFGFVEFISEEDADYAAKIMNQVRLHGKPVRVNKASADKQKNIEVGAELFVGNLDSSIEERGLYETFGRFGTLIAPPKIARDEMGLSKGYGFLSFADFDASDAAIEALNGQWLANKQVNIQYSFKKDGKGERHGDAAERELAAQAKKNNVQLNIQPLPAHLFQPVGLTGAPPPNAPPTPMGGPPPGPPNGYPPNGYPPQHHQPPPRPQAAPLPTPPPGLPSRPPSTNAGYGGPPQGFGGPPGFGPPGAGSPGPPPQGYGNHFGAPQGMSPPPPPGMPPGRAFGPPPGMPPGMPPPPGQFPPGYGQYGQPPPGQGYYGQRR